MKVPTRLIEKAEAEHSPTRVEVEELKRRNATTPVIDLDGAEGIERRKRMIASVAAEPLADAYERYVGENDLLPVNYLTIGYHQSQSVGRIRFYDRAEGKGAVATGFLITGDLIMTNHHVFPAKDAAEFKQLFQNATIDFNHEYDPDGRHPELVVFDLDPDRFFHAYEDLDVAIVAVTPRDQTGKCQLAKQGFLVLNRNLGKAGLGDFATIIQHPQGAEKQIAIRKNEIVNTALPDAIVYASDTAQGSSGAPVFNDQWQVIALHSAGVAKKNANGDYVDSSGNVIEKVNGRVDADRIVWESNRGIRVSAIMSYLEKTPGVAGHPLVQTMFAPAYTDARAFAFLSRPALEPERALDATIAAPPAPAAPRAASGGAGTVNINITISADGRVATTGAGQVALASESIAFEKKYEDELDLSGCEGYDDTFMGTRLPMPTPAPALRKKLAYLIDSPSAYTLKYHHFSTIHHAVRRVPVVCAMNVTGKHRYAELDVEGSRQDKWYRDNRIDYDVQLNDAFYAKSGFDRGHLGRREDAEWGYSLARAQLAADLTCSYANAVPQVPAINRYRFGYKGRWGKLELDLLEQGIELEQGKSAKYCVFSGPLFDEDDPVFKGVQVALGFFKVVVWYNAAKKKLQTTCFVLSQKKLVGEIEFEVLHFDEIFQTNQVPIHDIEKRTGLIFDASIKDIDTDQA